MMTDTLQGIGQRFGDLMNIYLINLDRAQDRRDYMLSELGRLLPEARVTRAMCVDIRADGWRLPEGVQPGHWNSDRWSLTASDIEIFRSHVDCWQKIAASGQTGLVLEDDLLFADAFGDTIRQLILQDRQQITRLDATPSPLLLGPSQPCNTGLVLTPVRSLAASAGAYMLDPGTADKLAQTVRIERTVDDYLFDPTPEDRGARGHGQPIMQLEPAVTLQAQFGTFSDPARDIPDFLKATKRVDTNTRKARVYSGPVAYRLRKEYLRLRYKARFATRRAQTETEGGRWGPPALHPDLAWV